ncbi:MAG: hypothetical protein KA479_07030 [Saprospiraceae bacterium]|jgi:TolA-binding protein|nr:hypothetical protein [Saprospiraceae bacterium]
MQLHQLNDQLDTLELKARQLAIRLKHMQGLNEELNALNHQLKRELEKANERIKHMESTPGNTVVGTTHLVADAREIKKEIQRYIDELDKCIEWLSKQP